MTSPLRTLFGVMAKSPRPGWVKTRLAQSTNETFAVAFARACLEDTWNTVNRVNGADAALFIAGERNRLPLLRPEPRITTQVPGDLGTKMEAAIHRGLKTHDRVVLLGTDCPHLTEERLRDAAKTLDTHDAVLGPAEDGGYYLIGMKRCPPQILSALPWSSPRTRLATLERLRSARLAVALLEQEFDVDELQTLRRLKAALDVTPEAAPSCAALLKQWEPPCAER